MATARNLTGTRKFHLLRLFLLMLTVAGLAASVAASAGASSAPAGVSMAQATPAPPAPGASSAGPQQSPQHRPMAMVEARIPELHKQLQITPAEEPQFKAYADVMRSNAQTMQTLFQQRAQNPDRSAIGMLRWYAKLTAAHAEAVSKLLPMFDALYQSMSAEQKKVADAVFAQLRQRPPPRRAE
jgi:periplasmic protein CpxP/Spy